MNEIKINEITIRFNEVEKFKRIKEHFEMIGEQEATDKEVAEFLLSIGMNNYKFL